MSSSLNQSREAHRHSERSSSSPDKEKEQTQYKSKRHRLMDKIVNLMQGVMKVDGDNQNNVAKQEQLQINMDSFNYCMLFGIHSC